MLHLIFSNLSSLSIFFSMRIYQIPLIQVGTFPHTYVYSIFYIYWIYNKLYEIVIKILLSWISCLFARERCVSPVSPARTETLRPINQRKGEQSTNFFFWHVPHFIYAGQRRYLAISLLRNGAAPTVEPRELKQPGPASDPLRRPYPVIPHSCTYATPVRDRGERQSGSATSGAPNTVPWHAEHGISVLEMSLL